MDEATLTAHIERVRQDGYTIVENAIEPELIEPLWILRGKPQSKLRNFSLIDTTGGAVLLFQCALLRSAIGFFRTLCEGSAIQIINPHVS